MVSTTAKIQHLQLRASNTAWSKKFKIESTTVEGYLSLLETRGHGPQKKFEVTLKSTMDDRIFKKSTFIVIEPRFVIRNSTHFPIQVVQKGVPFALSFPIAVGKGEIFHW